MTAGFRSRSPARSMVIPFATACIAQRRPHRGRNCWCRRRKYRWSGARALNGARASWAIENSMAPLIEVRSANERGASDQPIAEILRRGGVADRRPIDHDALRADAGPFDEGQSNASVTAGADGLEHARDRTWRRHSRRVAVGISLSRCCAKRRPPEPGADRRRRQTQRPGTIARLATTSPTTTFGHSLCRTHCIENRRQSRQKLDGIAKMALFDQALAAAMRFERKRNLNQSSGFRRAFNSEYGRGWLRQAPWSKAVRNRFPEPELVDVAISGTARMPP